MIVIDLVTLALAKKYTQETIKENERRLTRIYFKKNCDNWTTPRVYFYNTQGQSSGYNEPWSWDKSPYMLLNDEGYYYYPIPRGYTHVKFFCDKIEGALNFQTDGSTIPTNQIYSIPLYVQSDIGYDGYWADYATKMAKLVVQHNLNTAIDLATGTKVTNAYSIGDLTQPLKVYNLGLVHNKVLSANDYTESHYEYIEFPIHCKEIHFTFSEFNFDGTNIGNKVCKLSPMEVCYSYPVVYLKGIAFSNPNLSTITENPSFFNAEADSDLFSRISKSNEINNIYSNIDNINGNIHNIYSRLNGITGRNTVSETYENDHWDGTLKMDVTLQYYKIGRVVTCFVCPVVWDSLEEGCPDRDFFFNNFLPYPITRSCPSSYIEIPLGRGDTYMELRYNNTGITFHNVRRIGSLPISSTIFSYVTD